MKTSWNDLQLIERYLDNQLSADEAGSFRSRLLGEPEFMADVLAQSCVRRLVKKHRLVQLRQQAKMLHADLYNDPARRPLRLAIEALFKS